ncbi:hypothetical protein [Streptomyces nondiastaticus]|uniref:Fido domain-containing protein n=1 Tax=Streptomyces nondiastaticus TaxID=3154512 RepID=A0ABW6U8N5_9ACTN
MEKWQRTVLGQDFVGFRTMPAFAKGGRERYGLAPDTRARFERCLSESAQPDLPLPSRTARTYLDILFFHPFEDGNARAAMLASAFVLAREGILLDQVHPLQTTRWADDAEGAADLAVLLGILVTATERRLSRGRHAGTGALPPAATTSPLQQRRADAARGTGREAIHEDDRAARRTVGGHGRGHPVVLDHMAPGQRPAAGRRPMGLPELDPAGRGPRSHDDARSPRRPGAAGQ